MRTRTEIVRAAPEHSSDILRLLSVQLSEHHVDVAQVDLAGAVRGVFERPGRGFFLVAMLDRQCVGFAYVSFLWTMEHGGTSAWLEELYVEPEHREGGIGTALLREAMAECEAAGCTAIDLEIDADHERVRGLYERHGFAALPRSRVVKRL